MPDGSIRVAEATEDSLGTYTCVPYNALGTMGMSPPATLVLKVHHCSCLVHFLHVLSQIDVPVIGLVFVCLCRIPLILT